MARYLFSQRCFLSAIYCGGYRGEDPPLPIPNREVKLTIADGTAPPGGRVGSCRSSGLRSTYVDRSLFLCTIVQATEPLGLRQKTRPLAHLTVQLLLLVLLRKPNVVKQCPSCPVPCPVLMQASSCPAGLANNRCAGPATARFCQGSQGPIASPIVQVLTFGGVAGLGT